MYTNAYDEDEGELAIFPLGQRTYMFKGVKQRFFLYRVEYSYEGDDEETITTKYLGVAGAYSLTPTDMKRVAHSGGILYREEYDPAKVEQQFKTIIKLLEEEEY